MAPIDLYAEAIRSKVCSVCLDRTGRGICGLGSWDDCALNRFLKDIIIVVNSIQSNSMHDYVQELHNIICASCTDNPTGKCGLRETEECPLDRYFPLVVEAVQEVNARYKAAS